MKKNNTLFIAFFAFILTMQIVQSTFSQPQETSAEQTQVTHQESSNEHSIGMEPLFFIIIALIIGAGTRHFLKKSPLPYTVMLMIFGLIFGSLDRLQYLNSVQTMKLAVDWAGNIDPHIILFVFLPTLIFEAAFALDLHTFKKTLTNASILAVPGIIVALFLTALLIIGMQQIGIIDWGKDHWAIALMFGAVISATDPVAVTAVLKELGASKKLGTLIEGESMLNDGTAIVLFMVFYLPLIGTAGDSSPAVDFLRVSLGGMCIGLLVAAVSIAWVKRVFNDALVEISVIVTAAYITFYIAEGFLHVSGVIGLVALGVAMASIGRTRISPEVGHFLNEFWEMAAFIANTLIFVIVGVVIAQKSVFTLQNFIILLVVYVGIHCARACMIFTFYPILKKSGYGLPKNEAVILWYGGLRGAIALALALVVSGVSDHYISAEIRQQFLFIIAGTVLLTLLINATTIKYLLIRLGLADIPAVKKLMTYNAHRFISKTTEETMSIYKEDRFLTRADWNSVKQYLPTLSIPNIKPDEMISLDTLSETRRRILEKEKNSYWNQFNEGLLGAFAVQQLTRGISELLDYGGTLPLTQRVYLDHLLEISKILRVLQAIPILNRTARSRFSDRLTLNYDAARGFIVAQEEVVKLVEGLVKQHSDSADQEKNITIIESEIHQNRIRGLNYLHNLRNTYPEIATAIETKQAIRSILNYERSMIKKIENEGIIESDEAVAMIANVEQRMRQLVFHPPIAKLPTTEELLRSIPWLQGLEETIFSKVLRLVQNREYESGALLMSQGDTGDGMFVIARGSVKVMLHDQVIDIIGPGSVIGEMAVLLNMKRSATVVAESPVSALWLTSTGMQEIIASSRIMEEQLWRTAGARLTENLLGSVEPYRQWSQIQLRRFISQGSVRESSASKEAENAVIILLSGHGIKDGEKIVAPAILEANTDIEKGSKLFIIPK